MRKNTIYLLALLLLGGCSYPQEQRQQLDQLPEHIHHVQSAVDTYFREKKVLPFRYSEEERKLTTKYLVDFRELSGHLTQIPPSSFEKGGNFVYMLTDVERNPKVRLFDLRIQDKVENIQAVVRSYLQRNKRLPTKEKVGPQMQVLDLQKINLSSENIPSPYFPGENRGFLVDHVGRVYIDFRTDVLRFIQEKKFKVDGKEDLRLLLSRDSFYVPAYSPVIHYKDGDLILSPVLK